jgi:hypothetical protein
MTLPTERYHDQVGGWPQQGRHILACFDEHSIIVYQAYRARTARFAVEHGHFGDGFSFSRMSWIKPNFLWMMYRSGWGTKQGQEMTLGLRLRRECFDSILTQAVPSTYDELYFPTWEEWGRALHRSAVRLQWDPDHDPRGTPLERRAIQLGLRGEVLGAFGKRELLEVIDMTELVAGQRPHATSAGCADLRTPVERVYLPAHVEVGKRLGLASASAESSATADRPRG